MTQKLTILFDLDGTLVNTAPDLMAAHNHVMKKFGYKQKSLGDIKHIAGKGAWIMMQRTFKDNWAALIAATYPPGPPPITIKS